MSDSRLAMSRHHNQIGLLLLGQAHDLYEGFTFDNHLFHIDLSFQLRRDHFFQLQFHLLFHSVMILERGGEGTQRERSVKTNVLDHVDKKNSRLVLKSQRNCIVKSVRGRGREVGWEKNSSELNQFCLLTEMVCLTNGRKFDQGESNRGLCPI